MQHTGFQTFPILKAFLATFNVQLFYLQMVPSMYSMIQQAYKYATL